MAKVKKGNIVLTNQESLIIDGETVVSKERKGQFSSIALDSTSDLQITEFSTDGTLSSNSDSSIPTEKAVKTYVDNNSGGDVQVSGTPTPGQMAIWATTSSIEGSNITDLRGTEGITRAMFDVDDTTPDLTNDGTSINRYWQVDQVTTPTITNFDDGGDEILTAGDWFVLTVDYGATINFSTGNIIGNAGVDFTGSAAQPIDILFRYDGSAWIAQGFNFGLSTPTTLAISAIATPTLLPADLNDTTTPHVLLEQELMGKILSTGTSTDAREWQAPARSPGWDFLIIKEADASLTLTPNGTEQWWLRDDNTAYSQLTPGQAIVNTTSGRSTIACFSTNTDVYCSSDVNWGGHV